jgi:hypothetical protein
MVQQNRFFITRVALSINGISVDGWDTQSKHSDVYTQFFARYHRVVGDMMSSKAAGMTISDFDDNAFIVPFDLTNNGDCNLSNELIPAVRTGNITLHIDMNAMNRVTGLVALVFGEFPSRMEIDKHKNVSVSYQTQAPPPAAKK